MAEGSPESQSVTLSAGGSKTLTVAYPGLEGSVRYVLTPVEAVAAGAKWKISRRKAHHTSA